MSNFKKYLESSKEAYVEKKKTDLKQKVKDIIKTTIGRIKGKKVIIVHDNYELIGPMVLKFDAKTMREAKIGDLIVTAQDYEDLKSGQNIKTHMISDIDQDQGIIKIRRNPLSGMTMIKEGIKK